MLGSAQTKLPPLTLTSWVKGTSSFINIKVTAGQSANEDTKSILATYPKSAGGPILCAEAPVTIMHPGLSYLSRSSNMVQALRIPAWGFFRIFMVSARSSQSHHDIGLAQQHHPLIFKSSITAFVHFEQDFLGTAGRINCVEVCPKKILNRSLNYCATTLAQRHHTKTTQHLGTTWGNLETIGPLADLFRTKGLLWDYLATT